MVNKQDFLNAIEQNIEMVRGDTLAFNFQLHGLGNISDYQNLYASFRVAEHYDEDPVLVSDSVDGIVLEEYDTEKDTALFSVAVAPEKTKYLENMRYYYDLTFELSGDVITLMRGFFTLLHNV